MTRVIGAPTIDDALCVLRERIAKNEERGLRTLIFCEDRLTLLAERAVLDAVGGSFLTEVTTFARFLSGDTRVLSKQGSVVELSALISENQDKLTFFRKSAAQAVYETIAQLSASRVDAPLLRAGAAETDGILQGKLNDLAFLLEAYNEFLRERELVDENGYLALLPEAFRLANLTNTHIVFFAFTSFTRQAQAGVVAAIQSAREVTGIFLAGRAGFYTNEAAHIFRKCAEEIGEVTASIVKSSLSEEAAVLHDGLFSSDGVTPYPTQRVKRFVAVDEADELNTVAALIKRSIENGCRYRDIAVLVPDKGSFFMVEQVFTSYRIPFFCDKKRSLSTHPFCAFLLSVLTGIANGVLSEDADAIASSPYFGVGDNYRNYLLKYGSYRGAVKRAIKEGDAVKHYNARELNFCRDKMMQILSCFPTKGKGKVYTDGIFALMEAVECEKITQKMQEEFLGEEREFLSLSPLDEVLSEIRSVAGEIVFSAREFSALLQSALDAKEVSLLPQSVDAVFVGDATESKFERVEVLFVTGLTDALPRTAEDTAVISDGEIERLSELKVEIEPAIAQVNARAREGLALNLCAFTQELYLSYSVKRGENESRPSEILEEAERLFSMPAMPDLFLYACSERLPAELKLLSLKQEFESGRENDRTRYFALYSALKEQGVDVDRILGQGEKPAVKEAGELYFASAVSPTLLERYFTCPYMGFALQALRLREREERTVLDTDAGTFVHAVLERTAKRFNEFKEAEECRLAARAIGSELISTPKYAALFDTDAGRYTGERLIGEAEAVSVAAYLQLALSRFRVAETEMGITLEDLSLKGMADRIDVSDEYVRVIDYKTGRIDDAASAYYMGRKLQLELYLKAASAAVKPAGAFYFPAADDFAPPDENRFCMSGFFSGETEVISRMDTTLAEGEKSKLFEGRLDGKYTDKGMSQADFEAFIDYSVLVSRGAEREMKEGNISPSPHPDACGFCKMKSLCGFVGVPRAKESVRCKDIVNIVRKEKGE